MNNRSVHLYRRWLRRLGAGGLLASLMLWMMPVLSVLPTLAAPPADDLSPPPLDALLPPDAPLAAAALEGDGTPGFYQTSEYMIGRVAVGLILPESDGSREPNQEDWTDEEIAAIRREVEAGLAWWQQREPAARLTFTVEERIGIPTGYEPITHPQYEERLWIGEVMAQLGYEEDNYFTQVRRYVNDLRERTGADWAFAVFIVDSSADADGRFANGYFAYAYIGGPFLVMTYDNDGYGIHNMDAVLAHEIGHIFRALDQYATAGIGCEITSGYLNVETQNSQAGQCAMDLPSIMRGGISPFFSGAIDPYARGQIGWWDTDDDGILDPADTTPELRLQSVEEGGDRLSLGGWARDLPYPSPTLSDVTINTIAAVEHRLDNASGWEVAEAADGAFDTISETFRLTLTSLPVGLHTLSLRAVNSVGNVSPVVTHTFFIPDPVDGYLNTQVDSTLGPLHAEGPVTIQGLSTAAFGDPMPQGPTVAEVRYRVDDGEWQQAVPQDGAFDEVIEPFVILLDLEPGSYVIEVRTVNSDGVVEVNGYAQTVTVQQRFRTFLPLVASP